MFQLAGHFVKIITKYVDLITSFTFIPCFKIKICHLAGQLCQLGNWSGQPSGNCHDTHSTYNNNDNSYKEKEFIGDICTLTDTFQWTSDQEIIAVVKFSPALHIIHSDEAVMYLLNHTVIRFFQDFSRTIVRIKVAGIAEEQFASQLILVFRPAKIFGVILIDQHPGQIVSGTCLDDLRWQISLLTFPIILRHGICINLT